MTDDGSRHPTSIQSRLQAIRTLEAMHALEDQVANLQAKLREMEAQSHHAAHISFMMQRNQELERLVVSSFKETEAIRHEVVRLEKLRADHANALVVKSHENFALSQENSAQQQKIAAIQSQLSDVQQLNQNLMAKLSEAEAKWRQLEQEKLQQVNAPALLSQLESQQQRLLAVEEPPPPDPPVVCSICSGANKVANDKLKRQLDAVVRQRDKLSKALSDERGTIQSLQDDIAAKSNDVALLRAQIHLTNQELDKCRRYIQEAELSPSFERYMSLKAKNLMLVQQLEAVKSPASPTNPPFEPRPPVELKKKKPKNVIMPLVRTNSVTSNNNHGDRPSSWFRLNC
ncbi:hypothetical protein Ae201684_016264 [Aphanomyces euteiches]|uniref:Uncharacterized protein n=1 Tax=Aphanomyces euteiches TaxID=100861 RepID=A0A6G0WDF7_9STRA|nr:hypothetical protein Ae201684_016264 [Aphanomyces euteiches]KAH9153479.1 hypothetical protein AeRB84_004285 [Aphanomyces euteiches]